MRVADPVIIIVQGVQLNSDVIITSSPIRLGRGGRARLARLVINHQAATSGRRVCMPRTSIIDRLCVRS